MIPWVLVVGALAAPLKSPTLVDLGGPRQASATITRAGDDYVVRARLLPVACFDDATNARINHGRARHLALAGLARALAGGKDAELSVSGARVEEHGKEGKFYVLRLRVPQAGVVVVKPGTKPPAQPKAEKLAFAGDLFSRKRDHQQTLDRLGESLLDELTRLADEQRKKPDAEAFALAVAALEEKGEKNLDQLARLVKDDELLLFTERDDLTQAVAQARKDFLARLKQAVKREEKE